WRPVKCAESPTGRLELLGNQTFYYQEIGADESQNDSSGANRSEEPVLAADQILAISAAWTRYACRLFTTGCLNTAARSTRRTPRSQRRTLPGSDSGVHHFGQTCLRDCRPLSKERSIRRAGRAACDIAARGSKAPRRYNLSRAGV